MYLNQRHPYDAIESNRNLGSYTQAILAEFLLGMREGGGH
jgi:hypothetical protein